MPAVVDNEHYRSKFVDEIGMWQGSIDHNDETVKRINELAELVDAVTAFRVIMLRSSNLQYPGKPIETPVLQERAARLLMPRFGQSGSVNLNLILKLESLLVAFNDELLDAAGQSLGFKDPISHIPDGIDALRVHGDMVRGDAFPRQTTMLIDNVQEPFAQEYMSLVGLTPQTATRILFTIFDLLEDRGETIKGVIDEQVHSGDVDWVTLAKSASVPIEDLQSLFDDVSEEQISVFMELLSCSADNISEHAHSGRIRYKPVFVLPDMTVMVTPSISAAVDSIYFAFEEIAKTTHSMRDKYIEHASAWYERQCPIVS